MKRTILGTAIACALIPAGSASAEPNATLRGATCHSGGVMRAYPPSYIQPVDAGRTHRNPELVSWSPDLQKRVRRNGRWKWKTVRRSGWFSAFTSDYGFYQPSPGVGYAGGWAWTSDDTNAGMQFVPFYDLGPGKYRLKQYVWWGQLDEWWWYIYGKCTFYRP
jgi:hypothetical protein